MTLPIRSYFPSIEHDGDLLAAAVGRIMGSLDRDGESMTESLGIAGRRITIAGSRTGMRMTVEGSRGSRTYS
jgi:hypothetical protein